MNQSQQTMKAVRVTSFGAPDVLVYGDVPFPQPQPADLIVRVKACGVNPGEVKIRQGMFKDFHSPPLTLGYDFSGVIDSITEDASGMGFAPGDAIYAMPDSLRDGANAEYIAVRAKEVALKPKTLDFVQAASIPLSSLTAWQAIFDEGQLQPGQRILIHGAGGAVGSFAVQFAKWRGAWVAGTASGESDAAWLKKIGADEVIDYKAEPFESAISEPVDLVLDLISGETQRRSFAVIKRGGTLVTTLEMLSGADAQLHGVTVKRVEVSPIADQLRQIAELVDQGLVQTRIGQVFPLSETRQAHELMEHGSTGGKVVLQVA